MILADRDVILAPSRTGYQKFTHTEDWAAELFVVHEDSVKTGENIKTLANFCRAFKQSCFDLPYNGIVLSDTIHNDTSE